MKVPKETKEVFKVRISRILSTDLGQAMGLQVEMGLITCIEEVNPQLRTIMAIPRGNNSTSTTRTHLKHTIVQQLTAKCQAVLKIVSLLSKGSIQRQTIMLINLFNSK